MKLLLDIILSALILFAMFYFKKHHSTISIEESDDVVKRASF